jgi:hypothetical protein
MSLARGMVSILVIVLLFSTTALARTSLSGKWKGSSTGGDQGSTEFELDLKQDGEIISGTITINGDVINLSNGTFKNNKLELTIVTSDNKFNATAILEDGKLKGQWKDERGGEGTWTAEKKS